MKIKPKNNYTLTLRNYRSFSDVSSDESDESAELLEKPIEDKKDE